MPRTAISRPTLRCSWPSRRAATRGSWRRRSSTRCRRASWSSKIEIAGPGFINFHLSPQAYQQELSRIFELGPAYGYSKRGAGAEHGGRIRLGQSDRPAARRPRPAGGARRRARRAAAVAGLSRSAASSTTTTPACRSRTSRCRCRRARAASSPASRAGRRRPTTASTSRTSPTISSRRRPCTRSTASRSRPAARSTISTPSAASPSPTCATSRTSTCRSSACASTSTTSSRASTPTARSTRPCRALVASGKTYEKDGALWLRTTDYGDDKDRVMRKSDGTYTYFVPDVAYHVTKWQRGFRQRDQRAGHRPPRHDRARARGPAGARHRHSRGLSRLRPAQDGAGHARRRGSEDLQARRLLRHGARPDRLGRAATRCASSWCRARPIRSSCSTSIWRWRRAKRIPVYYVQYAHARVCSVFRQLQEKGLTHDREIGERNVARADRAAREGADPPRSPIIPELLETAARALEPHQLAHYLRELAGDFHTYYNAHTVHRRRRGAAQRAPEPGRGHAPGAGERPEAAGRVGAGEDGSRGNGWRG